MIAQGSSECSHLFVRVVDLHRRLWLFTPDVLVKRFQQGALEQDQGRPHVTTALPQDIVAAALVTEAHSTQLLHLREERNPEGLQAREDRRGSTWINLLHLGQAVSSSLSRCSLQVASCQQQSLLGLSSRQVDHRVRFWRLGLLILLLSRSFT